jgi:hypothetical protein
MSVFGVYWAAAWEGGLESLWTTRELAEAEVARREADDDDPEDGDPSRHWYITELYVHDTARVARGEG